MKLIKLIALLGTLAALSTVARTQPIIVNGTAPAIERWMYPFNAAPCDRPAGSVFGTSGDDAGVDTRHAQQLIGWDTGTLVPAGRAPARYLVRHCRITLTINRGNLFHYDPTHDGYQTYFETNHPGYLTDTDAGRPVEIFGAGFRNGFDGATFDQCALFGTNMPAQRNAFAAGWSTNGVLVDISNNVGKTNEAFPPFEVFPFAIGQTTNAAPGELVPPGAKMTFDLNLADPFVLQYAQSALDAGRLRLMVTSLHGSSGPTGIPSYPDFATHFNQAAVDPTRLELEVTLVRDLDIDGDGLPDDWEQFQFGDLSKDADDDPDLDGMSNLDEFRAGTDPLSSKSVLRFLPLTHDLAGRIALAFPHAASRRYSIDFTEDFGIWQTLTNAPTFQLGTGVAELTDDASSVALRYYRLRANAP